MKRKSELLSLDVSTADLHLCFKAHIIENFRSESLEVFEDVLNYHARGQEHSYSALYEAAAKAMFNENVNNCLEEYIKEPYNMNQKPTKENPAFGIITPTNYLGCATASNFHLVLAHLVATDDSYADFYKLMSDRGDYLIMDNGAFELGESYAPDKLIELASHCQANAIVLPDYPFQTAMKTVQASDAMIDVVKEAGFETMFVPQSEVDDLEDWVGAYEWASNHNDIDIIGMSILGIPNALPHLPKAYARVVMTQLLIDRKVFNFDKYHHYLGANAGLALEVPPLRKMGAMNSMDSSNPVWHAILGHEYSHNTDSYLPVNKIYMPVQFDFPMYNDSDTDRRIDTNITMSLDLFKYHQPPQRY